MKKLLIVDHGTPKGFTRIKTNKAQLWTTEKQPLLVLSFNTILPVSEKSEQFTTVLTPHGDALLSNHDIEHVKSLDTLPKLKGKAVVTQVLDFLDLPYLWAGMSSYGYDCSGFSYQMMKAAGYWIPRDASDQAASGLEVKKTNLASGK